MNPPSIAWRVASVAAALLFFAAAALQLNDPDPLGWVLLYGAAGLLSAASAVRWLPAALPAVVLGVCGLWLAVLVVGGLPDEPQPMAYGPQDGWLADEIVREGGGLLLVAAWMVALLWRGRGSSMSPGEET